MLSSSTTSQNPGRAELTHLCQVWPHGLLTYYCELKSWRAGRPTSVFLMSCGCLVSLTPSPSLQLLSSLWRERTNGLWTKWLYRLIIVIVILFILVDELRM